MRKDKLKWYVVNKKYINYLKKFDDKVENIDYNTNLKPYLGILLSVNNYNYYVPISSPKEKHYKMKDNIDFIKIINKEKIVGVLNINNMIPISNLDANTFKYNEIEQYRKFDSEKSQNTYISLLRLELKYINKNIDKIRTNAKKVYNEKLVNPNSKISKRSCNFKLLERKCEEWNETNNKLEQSDNEESNDEDLLF